MLQAFAWLLLTIGYDHTVTWSTFATAQRCEAARLDVVGRVRDSYCIPPGWKWTNNSDPQA